VRATEDGLDIVDLETAIPNARHAETPRRIRPGVRCAEPVIPAEVLQRSTRVCLPDHLDHLLLAESTLSHAYPPRASEENCREKRASLPGSGHTHLRVESDVEMTHQRLATGKLRNERFPGSAHL
jgi:hypothetical protein